MSVQKIWEKRKRKTKNSDFNDKSNKEVGKKQKPRKKSFISYYIVLLVVFAFVILGGYLSYRWIFKDLPSPRNLSNNSFPVSTEIYDRNGVLLYSVHADENRKPIKLEDVPEFVKQATVSIEDKNFYSHNGFAIKGILRAFYKNISQETLQGGSTITQQLVKTALLSPEKTIQRKIKELFLAWFTELIYSKEEILELYLNHIPYGGTAYGIEQASLLYFGKSAKNLNIAEGAVLAGLPQAPSRYSPFGANPELAKARQEQVLQRMVEDGYISDEEKQNALNLELKFAKQSTNIKAPHFVMYVKDILTEKYGQKRVEQGGLRVTTSLDYELQEVVQASLSAEIAKLENYQVSNGASLVTKPKTGEILAMIGSRGYFDDEIDGNVNLTTSLRQPGSSIKPLNYALGLLKGYTAATLFLDIPTCFTAPGQPTPYCPKNYDGQFHGPQQMRFALANSLNIPAVKMLAMNGVEDFIATASAMGISTWDDPSKYGLSLTLGGGEVKMTDLVTAFGVFANSGIRIDLNPILKVETYLGEVLEEHDHVNSPPAGKRVLPPEVTFILSNMLSDNGARVAAFGPNSELVIKGKTVSVKTGTTDDLRDNWTVGYTPEYVTAVWVGNNDNSKMNPYLVSGVTGAAPIWNDIMSFILKDQDDVIPPKPENVVGGTVCLSNNPDPNIPCEGRFEYFVKGTEKNPLHGALAKKEIWIDKDTQKPPPPDKTDNLVLKEKMVASDVFTRDYCLDCNMNDGENKEGAKIVNLDTFYEQQQNTKDSGN